MIINNIKIYYYIWKQLRHLEKIDATITQTQTQLIQ